jgi:nucleotide-binding universal stress UspA family protein
VPTGHTILFAADFSENSVEAFRVACSIGSGCETRLIVLHIIDPEADEAGTTPGAEALRDTLKRRMREVYIPDRPLDVDDRIGVGAATAEILRTAEEAGADLIAMGTHGRTGLRRLLAGSVAIDVLRQARCSVLALNNRRGAARGCGIRTILLPTDFSKASEAALGPARAGPGPGGTPRRPARHPAGSLCGRQHGGGDRPEGRPARPE